MSDNRVVMVESIIARERGYLDIGDVAISVGVGSLAEHGIDKLGATFGPPNDESSTDALIVIDPRAFEAGRDLEHIVRHELVHVAHGFRFGDDREAALEWLTDEVARLVYENRIAERDAPKSVIDLLRWARTQKHRPWNAMQADEEIAAWLASVAPAAEGA